MEVPDHQTSATRNKHQAVQHYHKTSANTTVSQVKNGTLLVKPISSSIPYRKSPLCECGDGAIENVEHYLLICSRYDRERAKLTKQVGFGGMWTEKLLGDPDFIQHTLEYDKNTKRMRF